MLLCHAATDDAQVVDVKSRLDALLEFATVDVLDCAYNTPSRTQLASYGAVLVWSNLNSFLNASLLGDNLVCVS